MQRKLVKQGQNATTTTLPAKWIKEQNLKPGDYVNITQEKDKLVINSEVVHKKLEVQINLENEEKSYIWHKLISKYIQGFDKLTITHNDASTIQEISNSFIGIIIEYHSDKKTVLKNIIEKPEDNIKQIIRRISHMLLEHASMLEKVVQKKSDHSDLKKYERLIDSNIMYSLRHINKYSTNQKEYKYFLICATFEEVADLISLISKHIKDNEKLAVKIKKIIEMYNKNIFSGNVKELYKKLREFRNSLKKESFLDGLCFQLAEVLYNNIGFLADE
jgi:phosphate uptake regulator